MEHPKSPEGNRSADPDTGATFQQPAVPKKSFKRRHLGKLLLLALIVVPIVGMVAWVSATLHWTYSSADRAGYVQKISHKGWLCKTWEGTLYTDIAKGFRSDSFQFSVRSDSVAHQLETLSGRKVSIHYDQHKGVPGKCFGDTEYFVSGVREIQ